MFLLYNVVLSLLAPIWAPLVWLKSFKRRERPIWSERFGNYPFEHEPGKRRVWVHAVSVGEVLAAEPILRELRNLLPGHEIVLSVTTSSGRRTAEGLVGLHDHLVYFPLDVARFTLAAMQRVQPDAVAIMETELWLNFLWAAKVFDARTVLVNGRISDRSFPRARRLRFFYRALFGKLDRALMQSDEDVRRALALGARSAENFGNAKFDQAASPEPDAVALRASLGLAEGEQAVVIGSTRGEAEEAFVLAALAASAAWREGKLRVIHAPRHVERAPALSRAVEVELGLAPALRSRGQTGRYLLLDTYGELAAVYAVADVAIVGGGFSNSGGQNLLQPLARGKPVVHGPHMQNFRAVSEAALAAGASISAATPAALAAALDGLLADAPRRARMGEAARALVAANQGSARRYAEAVASEAARG